MIRAAICATFKDEAPHLLEWVAYHRTIGFKHFFLYDNDSSDAGADTIRRSKLAEHVTIIPWPRRPGQMTAYKHFIETTAMSCEWVAFIDIDEFILPLDDATIDSALDRCASHAAILPQRRVFGPSAWETRPEGLVIENYTTRTADDFPANLRVRPIARGADLVDVTGNPHEFVLRGPVCDPVGQTVPNVAVQPLECHRGLVINHYPARSRQDWAAKVARGDPAPGDPASKLTLELFDHYAAMSTIRDDRIVAYAPRVRALLTPVRPPSELVWHRRGAFAFQAAQGAALVVCDVGRPGAPWYAAVRTRSPTQVDPAYLLDAAGRIRDFPSVDEARSACEAALERA